MTFLINAWVWTAIVLTVLFGFPIMTVLFVFTAPFDPGRYVAGRFFRLMAVWAVKLNPLWTFRTDGRLLLSPRHPFVAVSNHISYADIFLISHLPWEMKWLAKDTIFRIPVMGWIMRMAGDIPIVRGDRGSTVSAIEGCKDRLQKRVSVMIFPEGTRSRSGALQAFKDGAFRIAIEAGVPIVPIAVAGTRNAMEKGTFRFRRADAVCRVLDPVDTTGLSLADLPALKERVRVMIGDATEALRRELGVHETEGAAA